MSHRVIAVTGPASLRLEDRCLAIHKDGELAGKVPIEDMAVLVIDGPDVALTHQLLSFCAGESVAVVTSDEKHMPVALLQPLESHSLHSATLRDQIAASVPSQKRAWQTIVRAKIVAQSNLVRAIGGDDLKLRRLTAFVRSGDPDNVEARAAALYFERVFGEYFIRDREEPGINAMLNYGYAVVRSTVARAVVGAGLHPALGIHHRNQYNAFCLADDAMEPFRPIVDGVVWEVAEQDEVPDELDPPTKRRLVRCLGCQVRLGDQRLPFLVSLERYAASLRRAICESGSLEVPIPEEVLRK